MARSARPTSPTVPSPQDVTPTTDTSGDAPRVLHCLESELLQAGEHGVDLDLYMEVRDAGATHEEVLDGLGALVPDVIPPADSSRARLPSVLEEVVIRMWLEGYRIARRAGATHLEAQELYHRSYPPDRYAYLRARGLSHRVTMRRLDAAVFS